MIKLHLGCGGVRKEGFINIDFRKTVTTDRVLDMRKLSSFADGSVDAIETYHAIEHVHGFEAPAMFKEWFRVLKPGGTLVIECPDFEKNVEECKRRNFEGECLIMIYGMLRNVGDNHLWGWTRHTLDFALTEAGFVNIQQKDAQDYHTQYVGLDNLRVEVEKPR